MSDRPQGWQNWTKATKESDLEKVRAELEQIRKWQRTHLGIDFMASGADYPHPSQKVRMLYFFEGNGRLDPTGIQIAPLGTADQGIFWLDEFSDDPANSTPLMSVTASQTGSPPISSVQIKSNTDSNNYAIVMARSVVDQGFGQIQARSEGNIATLSFIAGRTGVIDSRLTLDSTDIQGVVIEPSGFTADPLFAVDGQIFWRSDTNRYRVRLGGTYYNLALGDVPTTMNKQPFAAKTTTYTTTANDGVISVDATSASFTVTLVSAVGNSGLTQTFKKINAANVVTIDANGSQTIDGVTTYALSAQWSWVTLVSNGANWLITGAG